MARNRSELALKRGQDSGGNCSSCGRVRSPKSGEPAVASPTNFIFVTLYDVIPTFERGIAYKPLNHCSTL